MKKRLFLMAIASVGTMATLGSMVASATTDMDTLEGFQNVSTIEETSYNGLRDTLVESIKNFESFVDISEYKVTDVEDLNDVVYEITFDYPQYFYLGSSYSYFYGMDGTIFALQLNYNMDEESYLEQKDMVDGKFSEIIDAIPETMSSYEKALLVHDYLCDNFDYDYTYSSRTISDFVSTGKGVCQAYTLSYSYILNQLGINSYSVSSSSIDHMWNMVELGGNYYHVDVTWDDCMSGLLGHFNHDNFLVTDATINQTHSTDWTLYHDFTATDDTFEKYSFTSSNSSYKVLSNRVYCLSGNSLCTYDFSSDSVTEISNLLDGFVWHDLTSSGLYYGGNFSSLIGYKNILIYNTPNSIVVTNTTGKILDTIYNNPDTTREIYGIAIQDGTLVAQLESNLDFSRSDFGTNLVSVCDIEEFYQERIVPRTDIDDDSDGDYVDVTSKAKIVVLSDGNLTLGDVNGDGNVKNNDAQIVRQYILHLDVNVGDDYQTLCDVNKDGNVKNNDVQLIRQYILHLINEL